MGAVTGDSNMYKCTSFSALFCICNAKVLSLGKLFREAKFFYNISKKCFVTYLKFYPTRLFRKIQ